ncbi:PIG-L family deacetylase [Myxococcota bacterium]|nr:PIG-L family deacetylase [Myxococcota bacterium]
MRSIRFDALQKVLFVGAHSDDIEIGCGGTVLKLVDENPGIEILWAVFSAEGGRRQEALRSAEAFLAGAKNPQVVVQDFRSSYFPYQGEQIKDFFETLKPFRPDVVFTHFREDRHQDHRVLSDLAWNTFRSHAILEYEIPKYDGDFGSPNFFVPLSEARCRRKAELVMEHFPSQAGKQWFTTDLFLAAPRIRGMECDSPTRMAEAFYSRKLTLS